MSLALLVPAASEPVSLTEAKAWLRLETDDEDDLVQSLIVAARRTIETATSRALVTQTWRLTLDRGCAFPPRGVSIPMAPIMSVVAVRMHDDDGTLQLLAAEDYAIVGGFDDARLVFTQSASNRAAEPSQIDVVAGYGGAADVPQPLRQAILMLVARWFENRGDGDTPNAGDLRGAVHALIAPYRRVRLT